MNPNWSSKFELKPGKWVFVPTIEAVDIGKRIKKAIEKCWTPPPYYFHLKAGGHVAALRLHLSHDIFLRIDIQDFFGSISRTRVTRCLKNKFGYKIAYSYANESTVPVPGAANRYVVPFGFVQSQIIAAVCLAESALGAYLSRISSNSDLALTVYVDDIIVSSSNATLLKSIHEGIEEAASRAHFILNTEKQEGPSAVITAFNILLARGSMKVSADRYQQFKEALAAATSEHQRAGIQSYVTSVNALQGADLLSKFSV
jgi:Reverse transcriptase (RNA-dependent DNA polymerase)